MNTTLRTALAVICILVITVCASLVFGRLVGRTRVADLTEHRLYTLSEGTRSILGKINQPITLKLYYSRTSAQDGPEHIRFWNNYYLYVRDLLDEFVDRSGGKLKLEVIDPRPNTDEEDDAREYGVSRFQLNPEDSFFFGLVATTEFGKDETIKFFEPDRQEFVEYDVAKILVSLMQREKRKIGVIAGAPILGTDMSPYMMQMMRMQGRQPEGPWTIVSHIRSQYEMEKVDLGGGPPPGPGAPPPPDPKGEPKIPEDIDFLMIVHPKNLDERTRYAIDQYIMKGGKAMVFVDPHCIQDRPAMPNPQMQMQHKANSDLNSLLEKWGVRMEPGQIAVDRNLGVRVSLRPNQPPERFPAYLQLGSDEVNTKEVVTADLDTIRLLFPGALTKLDGATTDIQPLLETSKTGNTWKPESPFELQMPDPAAINKKVTDGTKPLMLACLITGNLKTAFPDGIEIEVDAPPAEEEKPAEEPEKPAGEKGEAGTKGEAKDEAPKKDEAKKDDTEDAEKKEEKKDAAPKKIRHRTKPVTEAASGAAVIVVADVDLLTDMLAYERAFFGMALSGDNASFVFNCLDYLSGSEDLIAVRSRGRYQRPFKVFDEIEKDAEKATGKEVKAIQEKIKKFEEDLEKLGKEAEGKEDIGLLQSEALQKRQDLESQLRDARKQIRKLQAGRREKIEALEAGIKWLNFGWPLIILVIGTVLALIRWVRAKQYAARRV